MKDKTMEALEKLSYHEKLCSERYASLEKCLERIKEDIRILFNRWWIVLSGSIVVLLSVVGYLMNLLYKGQL